MMIMMMMMTTTTMMMMMDLNLRLAIEVVRLICDFLSFSGIEIGKILLLLNSLTVLSNTV
jgi:hypothetical protein